MSKAKWYNPTHNPIWDEYYQMWYLFTGLVTLLTVGIFLGAIL